MFSIIAFILLGYSLPYLQCTEGNGKWEAVDIKKSSILNIVLTSKNDIYAAVIDDKDGSQLIHSTNNGMSWESLPTVGSNLAMALTRDNRNLCVVGTKSYCVNIEQGSIANAQIQEFQLPMVYRDIQAFGSEGIAVIGVFKDPFTQKLVSGGMINSFEEEGAWEHFNIGLNEKEGYYAGSGAFPSNNTWYVTSGSWPVQNSLVSTMLSGRLNVIPGQGLSQFHSYTYEFTSLNTIKPDQFVGAISKTLDGGKTWKKILDSKNKYYFNQINCIDDNNCVVVGEGSFSSVILTTTDGGETWETRLKLNAAYSLRTCKMVSKDELWVAGGMIRDDHILIEKGHNQGDLSYLGVYYHSVDGGHSWKMSTSDGYAFDLGFTEERIGYAATINRNSCGIARLHNY